MGADGSIKVYDLEKAEKKRFALLTGEEWPKDWQQCFLRSKP